MPIQIVEGNLLHAKEQIIAHQVNGIGIMGGGLAKQIRETFPLVYKSYKQFVEKYPTPESLLGVNYMVTSDGLQVTEFNPQNPNQKIIANLFGQARISSIRKQTNEDALKQSLESLRDFAKITNFSVALPYGIGCGLGGGNWKDISQLIEEVFQDYPVTVYKFTK